MKREVRKRTRLIYALIGVVFLMGVGYAAFSTSLSINGTARTTNNWDVEIINITSTTSGTGENKVTPTWTALTANMEADLYEKGDYVEYEVTIKNKGTLDAKLNEITKNIRTNNEAIKITYSGYTKGERLYSSGHQGDTKVITVKVEYDSSYTGEIDYNTPTEVGVTFNYVQAEGKEGTDIPVPDTYLVTYDCVTNGGNACTDYNEYLKEGESVNLSHQGSKKEEYAFVGWNTNSSATEGLETLQMGNTDQTLYAIYTPDVIETTVNTVSTTKSITVVASATALSGVDKYEFSINGTNYIEGVKDSNNNSTYIFDNLEHNKTYPIYVKVTAKSGKRLTYQKEDRSCPYSEGEVWPFPYTGGVQTFTSQCYGTYTLEAWGAQGGNATAVQTYHGGYGGYATGTKTLNYNDTLYIYVGGKGIGATSKGQSLEGGYNGGGSVTGNSSVNHMTASGGGATHIATKSGLLKDLSGNRHTILLVAGGGGGGHDQSNHTSTGRWGYGGAGGGLTGQGGISTFNEETDIFTEAAPLAGTQTTGYAFGVGQSTNSSAARSGGGAGWYGGYSGAGTYNYNGTNLTPGSGSGGSSYIGGVDNGNTIAGTSSMPTHDGTSTMTGNADNGYAKVTLGTVSYNIPTQRLAVPTFTENVNGEVVVTYSSGCTNGKTCSYSTNGGSSWTTVSGTTTVYFGTNGTIIAKVTDGENEVSSTYQVVRNKLYVSNSGNDTTGYGTINYPYATVAKAYTQASTTATIYAMSGLTQTATVTMGSNKTITLTSCTKSGSGSSATCAYSSAYTLTRGSSLTSDVINQSTGTLTLSNITIDGNNVSANSPMIITANTLNINSGTTLKNAKTSAVTGGALNIGSAATVTMNAGTITGNTADGCSGALINWGTLNIKGGTISNNTASCGGAMQSLGTLNISGGTITGNTATTTSSGGGAIWNASDMTISGGTISSNTAKDGAGIYNTTYSNDSVSKTGNITVSGIAKIQNNTATHYGGGVYSGANASLEISEGTISGNSATGDGGGIAVLGASTMTGGTISGNNANIGGGALIIGLSATFQMSGGEISSNTSTSHSAGMLLWNSSQTTISGTAKIQNNQSGSYAGGIYVSQDSGKTLTSLTMTGGTISGNTAQTYIGGMGCDGNCTITGGSITGNTAGTYAGGIYVNTNGTVTTGGTANIKTNTNGSSYTYPENITNGGTFVDSRSSLTIKNTNYYIIPYTYTSLALDVAGGAAANNTNVQIYTKANSNRMKWKVYPRTVTSGTVYYGLASAVSSSTVAQYSQYLWKTSSTTTSGTNVYTYTKNGGTGGFYSFEKTGSYYNIKNINNGLCIHTASFASGANVTANTCSTSNNQKWKLSTS